jgi:uncharacterized circularly permuted ATP-grasp superfamily protein/uncharacterized alpha-E superfamily protein
VEKISRSTPHQDNTERFDVQALARTCLAGPGHFNELRGVTSPSAAQPAHEATDNLTAPADLAAVWRQFFEHIDDSDPQALDHKLRNLEHQIRDNGVTYNVYAEEAGPQRPWALDLFPLIIEPSHWQHIEAGVLQRMRLLEAVMADVYGPQQLLAKGLLPPALVQGHPGYLRAMQGVKPVGGTRLHIAAFDLARGPDGHWWVVSQRCQAPSGLGYALENRLAISSQFPEAFQSMRVQRLASTYRALVENLKQMSPAGQDSHLALLTPGPYNETYFEHAYLARYLGLTLVEGSDLTVRDERLYLKTLKALVPVHGLLKRVDDQYLDPLELLPESTLGVPGLLQAIRAGNVLVANMPGAAFLESPALLGFLPALSQELLGEELQLPALPTWWCGERSAMEVALPQLRDCVVKPTYPGVPLHGSFEAVQGPTLSARELDEWAGRIALQSEEHTVQTYLPLSQMPTWQASTQDANTPGQIVPRSAMLRVFAVSDGPQSWRVLPGGLARLAAGTAEISSMQSGGSSADVWALTDGEVDPYTLLQSRMTPASLAQRKRLVTSRAAENLFWLGRYTERCENAVRLSRLTLEYLNGDEQSSTSLLQWLSQMAVANTLVLPGVPTADQARRVFERSLISSLGSRDGATSVGYNLRALKMTASAVRERLSLEQWRVIVRAEEEVTTFCADQTARGDYAVHEALKMLKSSSEHLAAITGAQTDRMTRDDGWRLLSIGRHTERLGFLASALVRGFATGSVHTAPGFDAMLALFDSTITFHAQYQQSRDLVALINLLVLDSDNPRSMAWVTQTLRGRLSKLANSQVEDRSALHLKIPVPSTWSLAQLCETQANLIEPSDAPVAGVGYFFALNDLLLRCTSAAFAVSDEISTTYFTHSGQSDQSLST